MNTNQDGNYPEPCKFLNQLDCDESYIDKVYDSVRAAAAHKDKDRNTIMQLVNDKMEELKITDRDDVLKLWYLIDHQGIYDIADVDSNCLMDVSLYDAMDLEDIAREFVDDGFFGDIPSNSTLLNYIDFEELSEGLVQDGYDYVVYGDGYKDFGVFRQPN